MVLFYYYPIDLRGPLEKSVDEYYVQAMLIVAALAERAPAHIC